MTNWRRLSKPAGPHILEKCCHDQDLINRYCESLPDKAASFEGLESAVTALALDQAAQTGQMVDLEPVWKKLGR